MCGCCLLYKVGMTFPGCTCLKGLLLITMKSLLGTLVVLATFVTLCNSQCYLIPNQNLKPNECQDLKGVSHPLNSVWKTKDCEECTCGQDAISCCNTAAIPTGYDTNKCQKILNKKTCTYTVVEKKDPGKTCAVTGWVL